jgi:hypothetical protein
MPGSRDQQTRRAAPGRTAPRPQNGKPQQLSNYAGAGAQSSAIHAELVGSNECRFEGLHARAHSPVTVLCRMLVKAGYDPALPFEAFRGAVLCLCVKSLEAGAALIVHENKDGLYLSRWRPFLGMAPPSHNVSSPINKTTEEDNSLNRD